MVDWNTPTNSTLYTNVLTNLNDKHLSLAKQDYGSDTNVPTGAVRFNPTTKLYEKWSGSAWAVRAGEENVVPAFVTTTGTQPVYVVTPTVAWGSYVAGDVLAVNIHSANTGSATFNVSGLGAITAKWMGQNLVGGELTGKHLLVYDGANLNLVNHGGGWASYTPAGSGSFPASLTVNDAKYQRHGNRVDLILDVNANTTSTSTILGITLPVTAAVTTSMIPASIFDGGAKGAFALFGSSTVLNVYKYDASNFLTATSTVARLQGSYRV